MKMILIFLLFQISVAQIFAQGLYNNGAKIYANPNVFVYATSGLINSNSGIIAMNGMLTVKGILTNNATLTIENGASLIDNGTINGTGTNNIKLNVKKDLSHFVSASTNNALVNVFQGAYMSRFDEPTSQWIPITQGNSLNKLQGYSALYMNDATITYIGTPNTGSQSNLVSRQASGWNLAGNPYPSSMDWDAVGWTKTNIDNSIYLWNGSTYAVYNGTIGQGTNNATKFIPPMQGFFVRCNSATGGTLACDNSVRVHNSQTFFKKSTVQDAQKIRLQVSGNEYTDETLILFNNSANSDFDSETDAIKLLSPIKSAPQLYTLTSKSEKLAINSLQEITDEMVIPLSFVSGENGQHTITANELKIGSVQHVYLFDNQNNEFVDLLVNPSYSFFHNANDPSDRFNIQFSKSTTGIENIDNKINIFAKQKTIYFTINDTQTGNSKVKVYNMLGLEIANKQFSANTFELPLNQASGFYNVKLITKDKIINKKVFIE